MAESPFDPFNIGDDDKDERVASPVTTKTKTTTTTTAANSTIISSGSCSTSTSRTTNKNSTAKISTENLRRPNPKPLPPRMNVRFTLHEEVTSSALFDQSCEGGSLSQLFIEGKVVARIESSNHNQNAPFCLEISGPMASLANITCNDQYALRENDRGTRCKVHIPKSEVAGCEILSYSTNIKTQHMPILVQAKLAVKVKTCRISIQIRSNLRNKGDLSNFTIIIAIPTTLKGETVNVTRGENGVWDATKRIVTWKTRNLPHGESYLVSVEAEVSSALGDLLHENQLASKVVAEKIQCPVLVRCSSDIDQVSNLVFTASALEGVPATITQNHVCSYQLLHRVGKMGN